MAARSDAAGGLLGRLKSAAVQRIVGVVVLVITTLVVGAVRLGLTSLFGGGKSDEDASLLANNDHPAAEAPATPGKPAARNAAPAPASDPLLDAPAEDEEEPAPAARMASNSGSRSAAVTAVTPDRPKPGRITHVDEHVTYQYNALGRRDPFQSLINGEFVGADVGGDAPPDPGGIKVVGIVWGATDQFAMVEDVRGNSYVLRKGDKVQNGYVEALRREAVVVNVTADGQSQQVVIPLTRKGDDSNAR